MTPTMTTFDKNSMPTNLLMVQEWRRLARAWYGGQSWRHCARKWAARRGGALVWRADGDLITFTRRADGKISTRTYKHGTWNWACGTPAY